MPLLSPKNILIVKNRAMGDSVMGLSTVSYIRKLYPEAKLYYGLPAWVAPMYQNAETDVDEFIPLSINRLKDWWSLLRLLKSKKIDLIYEMHLSGRTKKFFGLYSKIFNVPFFYHDHHLAEGPQVHDQGKIKPLIQRDLDGAWSHLSKEGKPPYYLEYRPKINIKSEKKNQVILGLVATRETKKWPLEHYRELAKKISEYNSDLKILIPLAKSDGKIEEDFKSKTYPEQVEFIYSPLNELLEKLAGSLLYIGNDTGLKHICVALGVKTVTFFGPEPPLEWHPYNENEHLYFYRDGLECRTATAHYCGLSICDTMICLNQIFTEDVFKKIEPLLGQD